MHNEASTGLTFESVAWVVENDVWPDTGTRRTIDVPRRSTGAAFRSRPVGDLVRNGFVRTAGDSVEFHAPDAFVLLDTEFAESYCFWLEPTAPSDSERVGLGVYAAQPVPNRVTIEGVLWLKRDGALTHFDFQYVGLDKVLEPGQPGGRVEFLRLPSGRWIVSRWSIRMPQLGTEMQTIGISSRQTPFKRLVRVVERGAFVSRVVFNGSEFLELGRQTLSLTLRSRDGSAQPLVGTAVRLPADDREWVVDTSRTVRVEHMIPGRHRFLVQTPLMRDVGLPSETVDLVIAPDTTEVTATLPVPSPSDVRRRLCPGSDKDAVAVGMIAQHEPTLGAVYVSRASDVTEGVGVTRRGVVATVDSAGRWHACGLARATSLVLWTDNSGITRTLTRFRIPRGLDIALVGSPNANAVAVTAGAPTAERASAVLTVRAFARDASPLLDAEAVIDDSLVARPNARGELRFFDVDDGTHLLTVRRLGYAPSTRTVRLSHDRPRIDSVYLDRIAQTLAEVRVQGRIVRVPLKFVDVVRRSASGWGTVFTREEIQAATDLKSLLVTLPGVRVTGREIRFERCAGELAGPSQTDNLRPKVQVYIDGVRVTMLPAILEVNDNTRPGGTNDPITAALRLVHPNDVELMEVYRGVAQIPVDFVNDACAVIAIWTKAY